MDDLPPAKSNLRDSRRESQTSLSAVILSFVRNISCEFLLEKLRGGAKKVLALTRFDPQNNDDGTLAVSAGSFTLVHPSINPESMSQTQPPDNELARLRAVVADSEKKMSEAAELVARVRHEINNPLAALLGQAQLLLREELSEKLRRRAQTIETQAKRIQEIVGELRAVQAPPPASNHNQR